MPTKRSSDEGSERVSRKKRLEDIKWQVTQDQVRVWASRNFPNAGLLEPTLGICEESGELTECIYYFPENIEEIEDALGDILIYLIDFSNKFELNLNKIQKSTHDWTAANLNDLEACCLLLMECGKLSHGVLKSHQGVRGDQTADVIKALNAILDLCEFFANEHCERGLGDILDDVWAHVRQRDWINFPKNGKSE